MGVISTTFLKYRFLDLMGPLSGFKVIEIAGIGPAPAAAKMLADLGADVILIERKTNNPNVVSHIRSV